MPLRTVTSAPSVPYPLSETYSYKSKCPVGMSVTLLVYYSQEVSYSS